MASHINQPKTCWVMHLEVPFGTMQPSVGRSFVCTTCYHRLCLSPFSRLNVLNLMCFTTLGWYQSMTASENWSHSNMYNLPCRIHWSKKKVKVASCSKKDTFLKTVRQIFNTEFLPQENYYQRKMEPESD